MSIELASDELDTDLVDLLRLFGHELAEFVITERRQVRITWVSEGEGER